jgi:phage baseplate assembly protein W
MNRDVGLRYPFGFSGGRTATAGGRHSSPPTNEDRDAAVRGGVLQLLKTEKGARVMLCDIGAGLSRWIFNPIPGAHVLIPQDVRRAVEDFCSRARIGNVEVAPDTSEGGIAVALTVRHDDAESESVLRVAVRSS